MIDHENVKIRFRVIRTCLIIIRNLGFLSYLNDVDDGDEDDDPLNKTDSSFYTNPDTSISRIDDPEDSGKGNVLTRILQVLAKLSREATYDPLFTEEGIPPFLLEILSCAPQLKGNLPSRQFVYVLITIKNISGTEQFRKKMLEIKNCTIFSNLLDIINENVHGNKKYNFAQKVLKA
jgi:hypothetical protein